ncbi:hypothetical protein [Streptomyces drozdowiczii]|uniref:Uncharacterized protein n=1 Tax=Streptomyces drozdowiczii TaxID=202862 RepID=A0ABY6Q1B1_9ACTN|nr:hypothetical protein [Streptomyces drozdowiczii]MCX0247971.1 hypothetical protein [Streptomyces drozdowiczii]UZK58233.1 hypothetical protein NEH16_32865 [Streptomyces drozdowiczii]
MSTDLITWYDDITINGVPYPTRNTSPLNTQNSSDYLGDLPSHHRHTLRAHHEAAHAITSLAAGGHIHHAQLAPPSTADSLPATGASMRSSGAVTGCGLHHGNDYAMVFAAGERAEDHWLRQNNLWTPDRAVGVELCAYADRTAFLAGCPDAGFNGGASDYCHAHNLADQAITHHWDAITAVAQVLADRLYLTGQELAAIAQMPNGTHTCNRPC